MFQCVGHCSEWCPTSIDIDIDIDGGGGFIHPHHRLICESC